jgi:hypothetical protein
MYKYYPGMIMEDAVDEYIQELIEKGSEARKCIIYT